MEPSAHDLHQPTWRSRQVASDQSCELAGTPRRSTVLSQEGFEITPALAFVPSKSQRPAPAAFVLAGRLRAGVDDDADWMSVLSAVKVE